MAWLAENLRKFQGSGIIYCLTVPDTERVTRWLRENGFNARAYHAGNDAEGNREELEQDFLRNEVQILVATVALGMGFDKPDIQFVIHFQSPASVIAYYQQVGRAGRAVDVSYGILLSGDEDEEIQNYFIETAFPSVQSMQEILHVLEKSDVVSRDELLAKANIAPTVLEKALKMLELEGAIGRASENAAYYRTPNEWQPDTERIERVLAQRRAEQNQMRAYLEHEGCLMEFLLRALDDPNPQPCGRCANCKGKGLPTAVSPEWVTKAETFLKESEVVIEPRKQWPSGLFPTEKRAIPPNLQNRPGRSLCVYGDAGWGELVKIGKYRDGRFSDELVKASCSLIRQKWRPDPFPKWVTAIPSRRHPTLVSDFAARLAQKLGIPFYPVLVRVSDAPEQKMMQNSFQQANNVLGTIKIEGNVPAQPVLLVDDILDSGWTLTMAGRLLREHGSGEVFPFTLAKATGRNTT